MDSKRAILRGQTITPEPLPTMGHRRHLDNLGLQIEVGKPNYAIAQSSLMALELCEGAYLSSLHGAQVTFPLEEWRPSPSDWTPGQLYSGIGGRDGRNLPK